MWKEHIKLFGCHSGTTRNFSQLWSQISWNLALVWQFQSYILCHIWIFNGHSSEEIVSNFYSIWMQIFLLWQIYSYQINKSKSPHFVSLCYTFVGNIIAYRGSRDYLVNVSNYSHISAHRHDRAICSARPNLSYFGEHLGKIRFLTMALYL